MNSRKRYFNTINFQLILTQRLHSPVVKGRTFFAGGSWDAGSNPSMASSSFFFSFIVFLPFGFLLSSLTAGPVSFARFLRKRISSVITMYVPNRIKKSIKNKVKVGYGTNT